MKRKSTRKTDKKKTPNSVYDKIRSFSVQILSFIFGVFAAVKAALYPEDRKTKNTGRVKTIQTDKLKEQTLRKAKELLISAKAEIKKVLSKIKEMLMSAEAEIKLALSQANARRAFNKAAKKAGKERRAAEKLEPSKVKERKIPSNSVAEKASNKTTAKNSAGKTKRKKSSSRKKKKPIPLYRRVLSLMIKVSIFALGLIIVFGYIFGLSRNQSLNMQPAFQDGDLILYLRTYNSYSANDTVLILYDDKTMLERVIAVAGDTVDITEAGLMVNGGLVQESYAWGETTQFKDGVTFPLTVPEGKIFVLGDNREHATDSRVLGCIDERDVSGSVIGSFRRRNF